ncbi:MAG: hypothetical protein Q7S84_01770 [bacterium]|nr:hypothetical protein [bacterium]
MMNHHSQKVTRDPSAGRAGSTILEAVVAVSVAIVGLTGILQLTARSFQANTVAVDRLIAARLAEEGVEIVRSYVDWMVSRNSYNSGENILWRDIPSHLPDGFYEVSWAQSDVPDSPHWSSEPSPSSRPSLRVDADTPAYGYDAGISTVFRRIVRVTWAPVNSLGESVSSSISSIVRWETRGNSQELIVEGVVYHWRGK